MASQTAYTAYQFYRC